MLSKDLFLKYILLLSISFVLQIGISQDIKVMSYNILTFPEEGGIDRTDTLGKIIRYYEPDLFFIQELKSEQGFLDILADFNDWKDNYDGGTYVDQISNPSNSWRLQQNIIFNKNLFSLIEEEVIVTDYRDVNYYKLYFKDGQKGDSTFLHIYNTHLKSSTGVNNEQLRLGMAEFVIDHIRNLPQNSKIMVAGDFNVYSSSEPAYQHLLSENATNQLHDPINRPDWANNVIGHAEILTQSTRANSPGNGAGGGIDDRFDFVLISTAMKGNSNLSYIEESYQALGNNGTCYNQSLLDCATGNEVPFDILRSLQNMSDHIPVVLSLNNPFDISSLVEEHKFEINLYPNPAKDIINLSINSRLPDYIKINNSVGKTIKTLTPKTSEMSIHISHLNPGIYFVTGVFKDHHISQKFIIL